MQIEYRVNTPVTPQEFTRLLNDSFLGERRPVDDPECMAGMIENANLVVSAWDKDRLVGISRCVTDFHYACYLSDLAVHREYQKAGIGRQLQALTQQQLGPRCKLILIAAPAAEHYYEPLGYEHNDRCWVLDRDKPVR
ncbi:MAG: GNAT family N-acetyltransferase [Alcanivorax nanhaiticus]